MKTPPMDKTALRNWHKTLRKRMPEEEKNRNDIKIYECISTLNVFDSADTVLCYVSGEIEVDTRRILQNALNRKKAVYVPRCSKTLHGVMHFYRIYSFDQDLKPGVFGVWEPIYGCERLTDLSDGLCIVPGLAYDRAGFRLGFGKGYYDRFLARFSGKTVGLCYDENRMTILPHSEYDRSVQMIVTQSGYHGIPH